MKVTKNLSEFQKFLDNDSKTGMCLEDTIGFFDVRRIFGQFESIKQSGIRVTRIMTFNEEVNRYHPPVKNDTTLLKLS